MAAAPVLPASSAPTPQPAPLSQGARIIDTFVAPSKTFTDIRRSASWWLPWLLGAIIGGAMVYTVDKKVGMEKVVENQIQLSPKAAARMDQLPPDQRQAQIDTQTKITRDFSYGFSLVSLVIL